MSTNDWPAWYFGPRGERRIFEQASDVPEGWADTPAAFPAVAEAPTPAPADNDGELARLSDLVAKFQAERDKLAEALASLGFAVDAGPDGESPAQRALFALADVMDERDRLKSENDELRAQLAPLDGDNDGRPGGLRGERKVIMDKLKAAGTPFKPTLSTAALKALLEGPAE